MQRRRLISWFFALALIFGQGAAFAHALGHLETQDSALPHTVCEVCVAQAHLGNAAPSTPLVIALPAGAPAEPARATSPLPGAPRLATRARAPPASI